MTGDDLLVGVEDEPANAPVSQSMDISRQRERDERTSRHVHDEDIPSISHTLMSESVITLPIRSITKNQKTSNCHTDNDGDEDDEDDDYALPRVPSNSPLHGALTFASTSKTPDAAVTEGLHLPRSPVMRSTVSSRRDATDQSENQPESLKEQLRNVNAMLEDKEEAVDAAQSEVAKASLRLATAEAKIQSLEFELEDALRQVEKSQSTLNNILTLWGKQQQGEGAGSSAQ